MSLCATPSTKQICLQ